MEDKQGHLWGSFAMEERRKKKRGVESWKINKLVEFLPCVMGGCRLGVAVSFREGAEPLRTALGGCSLGMQAGLESSSEGVL